MDRIRDDCPEADKMCSMKHLTSKNRGLPNGPSVQKPTVHSYIKGNMDPDVFIERGDMDEEAGAAQHTFQFLWQLYHLHAQQSTFSFSLQGEKCGVGICSGVGFYSAEYGVTPGRSP